MKKLILIVLIFALAHNVNGQTIIHDTVVYTKNAGCFQKNNIGHAVYDSIYNNTPNTILVTWSLSSLTSLLNGWTIASVCDPKQCYPTNLLSSNHSFQLASGAYGSIEVLMSAIPTGLDGTSYGVISTNYGDMTYKFSTCPLSVFDEYSNDNIAIYPNPTSDYLTIENKNNKSMSFLLADILGNIFYNSNAIHSNSTITTSIKHLNAGIYFLVAKDEAGNKLGIKKIVKN